MEISFILLVIAISLVLLPLVLILPRNLKIIVSFAISLLIALGSSTLAIMAFMEEGVSYELVKIPILGIVQLKLDLLSAFFVLIINFVVLASNCYGIGYLKNYSNPIAINMHYFIFTILHISLLLVCSVQNWFVFLIVWEVMSISTSFLVMFEYEKEEVTQAGMNYLIQMHIGVLFLMFASIWLYKETGSFDFEALRLFMSGNESNFFLFLLFFIGFGIKAGFVPFHSWLPLAHPAAPSHISALMSGVIIKMGIYGILRVLTYVQSDHLIIGVMVLLMSSFTAIYGVSNAIVQRDLKKMLAFSSIENIGIIGIGIGMGMIGIGINDQPMAFLGFIGAFFHIINHAFFKPLLFFGAGAVYSSTHTRNINLLGALIKKMPYTGVFFLIGAISISGLPPFNGFVSEFVLYQGILEGMNASNVFIEVLLLLAMVSLALVGGLSIFAFTKAFGLTFLGVARSKNAQEAQEVSIFMLIPQVFCILGILSIVIFPQFYFNAFTLIVNRYVDIYDLIKISSMDSLQSDEIIGFTFITIVLVLFSIRTIINRMNKVSYGDGWGCGYLSLDSKFQYTSNSYAGFALKLIRPLLGYKATYQPIAKNDIFPKDRRLETQNFDILEKRLFIIPIAWMIGFIKRFAVIETGKTQSYITYAFIFILVLFVITFFDLFSLKISISF